MKTKKATKEELPISEPSEELILDANEKYKLYEDWYKEWTTAKEKTKNQRYEH